MKSNCYNQMYFLCLLKEVLKLSLMHIICDSTCGYINRCTALFFFFQPCQDICSVPIYLTEFHRHGLIARWEQLEVR